jgi:hypothetical protein
MSISLSDYLLFLSIIKFEIVALYNTKAGKWETGKHINLQTVSFRSWYADVKMQ